MLEPISDLEPSSSQLKAKAQSAFNDIDCIGKKISGSSVSRDDWEEIEESWIAVAKSLITSARFQFDQDEFDRLSACLGPFLHRHEELHHHMQYEKGLWFVYAVDFDSVETLVDGWDTRNCDPVWMMRKAALLFELGRTKEADDLNMQALEAIRSVSPEDGSAAIQCRESWALLCSGSSMSYEKFWHASMEWRQRWDALTSIKCNVALEMRRYADAMRDKIRGEEGRPFDLGRSWGKTISFSRNTYNLWAAGHRAIRGAEVAGLPPTLPGRTVASDNLALAARRLVMHESELAARLILRAARYETRGALDFVVSRPFVARITEAEAKRLANSCVSGVEFIRRRCSVAEMRRHWMDRMPVLLEALSRFVLRLDADYVDGILTKALRWYEDRVIHGYMLQAAPLGNLIARVWETLPVDRRKDRVLDLLLAPILGMGGFGNDAFDPRRYPDPIDVLAKEDCNGVVRTPENESGWSEVLSPIAWGMRGEHEGRRRATRRMSWVVDFAILTPSEEAQFALMLWGDDYESHRDLPKGTDIYDWAFMVMPEPSPGIAERRFREKWLSVGGDQDSDQRDTSEVLWEVGSALGNLQQRSVTFALSESEQEYLTSIIEAWAQERVPVPLSIADDGAQIYVDDADVKLKRAIQGLQYLLLEIDLSTTIGETVYDKVHSLVDTEMPGTILLVGLLRCLPDRLAAVGQLLRIGLVSDNPRIASDAAETLAFWLAAKNSRFSSVVEVPIDLIREVGVVIATRRKAALIQALGIAKDVFAEENDVHKDAIGNLCVHGLEYLAEELSYNVLHSEDIDVPLLRWGCTQLSVAMSQCGWHGSNAVVRWIENAESDPLPEIRRVDSSHALHEK
ncbi:MAG: hypothetical protein OXI95_16160 [bacterium]|nr:hypothetical protein [bacterium]